MSIPEQNEAFVRWLQSRLNALGAIPRLALDGWAPLGGKTHAAVAERLSPAQPDGVISVSGLQLSHSGIDIIIGFEIGDANYYDRYLSRPSWPGGASGVTIGVGYDLGYNTQDTFQDDWAAHIDPSQGAQLQDACGLRGDRARAWLVSNPEIRRISVGLAAAKSVFAERTLPRFAAAAAATFGGIELLPADAQAMVVSLVFNRGTSLAGPSRREMAEIAERLRIAQLRGFGTRDDILFIAAQVRAMKRLWSLGGLLRRRDTEADVIAGSI